MVDRKDLRANLKYHIKEKDKRDGYHPLAEVWASETVAPRGGDNDAIVVMM